MVTWIVVMTDILVADEVMLAWVYVMHLVELLLWLHLYWLHWSRYGTALWPFCHLAVAWSSPVACSRIGGDAPSVYVA